MAFMTLPRISSGLRTLFCTLALLLGVGFTQVAFAADGLNDKIGTAVDDAMTQADPSASNMAPVMEQTNEAARWLIIVLWVIVPLILFGGLIAWGVWQAKQNEMSAAWKTFAAVLIGVIFYFGVLAIFGGN